MSNRTPRTDPKGVSRTPAPALREAVIAVRSSATEGPEPAKGGFPAQDHHGLEQRRADPAADREALRRAAMKMPMKCKVRVRETPGVHATEEGAA